MLLEISFFGEIAGWLPLYFLGNVSFSGIFLEICLLFECSFLESASECTCASLFGKSTDGKRYVKICTKEGIIYLSRRGVVNP